MRVPTLFGLVMALLSCTTEAARTDLLDCIYTPSSKVTQYPQRTPFPNCAFDDENGDLVILPEHLARLHFDDGLAEVKVEGRYFYVNERGRTAPVITFDNGADDFVEGLARTRRDGKVGFIDRDFRLVIPARYDWAFTFENGTAMVCSGCVQKPEGEHTTVVGGLWGYIDTEGREVVPVAHRCAELPEIADRSERCRNE